MRNLNLKLITILGLLLVGVFIFSTFKLNNTQTTPDLEKGNQTASVDEQPKIISTKPDPLEEAIISANETIEITFNRSLENEGEFKLRIEPKAGYKIQLTQDRKTAKIIPSKPYELGSTYTLFIGPDTKFIGLGEWRQEKIYHFKTIKYRGV